jgi:hypothetical protein
MQSVEQITEGIPQKVFCYPALQDGGSPHVGCKKSVAKIYFQS